MSEIIILHYEYAVLQRFATFFTVSPGTFIPSIGHAGVDYNGISRRQDKGKCVLLMFTDFVLFKSIHAMWVQMNLQLTGYSEVDDM